MALNSPFFLLCSDILQAFSPLQQLQPHCNNKNRGAGQASSLRSLSKQVLRLQVLWIICTVVPVYVTLFWFRLLAKSLAAHQCYCFKQWSNFSTAPEPSITLTASTYFGFLTFANIEDVAGATSVTCLWISSRLGKCYIFKLQFQSAVHLRTLLSVPSTVWRVDAVIYPKDTPVILPLTVVEASQLPPVSSRWEGDSPYLFSCSFLIGNTKRREFEHFSGHFESHHQRTHRLASMPVQAPSVLNPLDPGPEPVMAGLHLFAEEISLLSHLYFSKISRVFLPQCHPARDGQRGKCWCVDQKTGMRLPGPLELRGDLDCHQLITATLRDWSRRRRRGAMRPAELYRCLLVEPYEERIPQPLFTRGFAELVEQKQNHSAKSFS